MQQTIRQQIAELLSLAPCSVREISQTVGIPEKEVYLHLSHIEKSLKNKGRSLKTTPYQCQDCGFVFKDRARLNKPGRCPACRKSHIRPALFSLDPPPS